MDSIWRRMSFATNAGFQRICHEIVVIRRRLTGIGVLALWVAVAAGCATTMGPLGKDPPVAEKQAVVAERAAGRWQAMIKGEYEKAYAYMSATSRQATSLDRFRSRSRAVVFREAKVKGVVCDADACKADVFVTFDHARMKGAGNSVEETWVIEQGQAWYVDPIK
jgi:hypothetical protein